MHEAADTGVVSADEHGHACGSLERASWAELYLVLQARHRHSQVSLASSPATTHSSVHRMGIFENSVAHNEINQRLLMT